MLAYSAILGGSKGSNRYGDYADDRWISRQELADRYGLPVKTPAEWASKGTGPRYGKFGRHVRYRMSDVIDWERAQLTEGRRDSA